MRLGLWIDDDERFLERTIPLLAEFGISMKPITDAEEAIQELRRNPGSYSHVFLDLAMPGKDGVDVFREIRSFDESIPIIFISAHLDEPKWELRLESAGHDLPRIEKPFPVTTSPDFTRTISKIKTLVPNCEAESLTENPFRVSYRDFISMDDNQLDDLFEAAAKMNAIFVAEEFEKDLQLGWLVIVQRAGNVLKRGSAEEPTEEAMLKLAKEFDGPIFLYSRPSVVEEIGSSWSVKSQEDYYPTINISFPSGETEFDLIADFDTGARESFVSFEYVDSNSLIRGRRRFRRRSILWGNAYYYHSEDVPCRVRCEQSTVDIMFQFRAVRDWGNSPMTAHYQNRVALVGRNIILHNRLMVLLDGDERRTDVLAYC